MVVVGALLAAATGIVGASVVTMGLLSLPTMLKRGYSKTVATGTIAASGTLGQIIPPSIVLILLGSILNISIGDMFIAATLPGLLLVILYILWIIGISIVKPELVPAMPPEELDKYRGKKTFYKGIKSTYTSTLSNNCSAWINICGHCLSNRGCSSRSIWCNPAHYP